MAVLAFTSRLNAVRLNAFRLGAGDYVSQFYVDGVEITRLVRKYESEILEYANATPNTCTLALRGTPPIEGKQVTIRVGSRLAFDGLITAVTLIQKRVGTRPHWRIEGIDWTRQLDRRLVYKQYTAQSPNYILSDLMATYGSSFTTNGVEIGLQWLNAVAATDWLFSGEPLSSVLSTLADATGAAWKAGYDKDLYFRVTNTLTNPIVLDVNAVGSSKRFLDPKYTRKLDQVRTRIHVIGAGSTVDSSVAVPASSSVIPVQDASAFQVAGDGMAGGRGTFSFTGASTVVTGSTALGALSNPSAPTLNGTSGGILSGNYKWAVSFVFEDSFGHSLGESEVGSAVSLGVTNSFVSINIPTGPSGCVARRIWRSRVNGSDLYARDVVQDNSATVYSDNAADSTLTAAAPTDSTATTRVAATSLRVQDIIQFPSSGGVVKAGGVVIAYTGRSGSSGAGTLTGIPSSGFGSITAAISHGQTVTCVPFVFGVSGLLYALNPGDRVSLYTMREDAAAQAALAALEGGDGIHEFQVTDTALTNFTTMNARGDAELALAKGVEETLRYVTEDKSTIVGATVTANVPGIVTSLPIQQQRIFWTDGRRWPQREITAANRFKDLYQYIGEIQRQAAKV